MGCLRVALPPSPVLPEAQMTEENDHVGLRQDDEPWYLPEIVTRISAALSRKQAAKETEDTRNPAGVDRMSAAGRCYRERWFTFRGYEMDTGKGFSWNPRLLRIFRLGHIIEDEVVSLLEASGYAVKSQQLELGTGKWLGHIDGLIDMGRGGIPDWCLLEIKSANTARFELLKQLGSYGAWNKGYAAQIQAYLYHLDGIQDAVVIVYNKDSSELYTERVLFDLDVALEIERQSELVTGLREASATPPARPEEAKTQYGHFCKWCDFNQRCWGGAVDVEFDD